MFKKKNCFSTSFCTNTSSFEHGRRKKKKKQQQKSNLISQIMFLSWNKVNLLQTSGWHRTQPVVVHSWRSENLWLQNVNMMHGAVSEKTGFFPLGFLSVILTGGFQIFFQVSYRRKKKKKKKKKNQQNNNPTTKTKQQHTFQLCQVDSSIEISKQAGSIHRIRARCTDRHGYIVDIIPHMYSHWKQLCQKCSKVICT